ncbi:hypothetical protein [Butyrivibrio sp. INlla14]|uniref:hypothetical protein n=1 Tax=Butyrivibrio sp. INlla14 TaxID=1520808 RepID=UPI0008762F1E|nr:hypothetical protein [Butyrivibrio sp. INlla14]SCY64862.1 hypothetical protein SAMN02910371_03195 [Butyrivibrio sp. INlla14]
MKTWNSAEIVELALNQTAGGSFDITTHDGKIVYTTLANGRQVPSEQYAYVSGEQHA